MEKRNDGKTFEKLVYVLQEAFKDSEHTKVHHNYKAKDKHGNKRPRQFDVFIKTKINNFDINIAIECKDHKRKIGADKVGAFSRKCETIPDICKKIIVSPIGFQDRAIIDAKLFDIDLYTLDSANINIDVVSKWIEVAGLRRLKGKHNLRKTLLVLDDKITIEAGSEKLPLFTKVTTSEGEIAPLQAIIENTYLAYYDYIATIYADKIYEISLKEKRKVFHLFYPYNIDGKPTPMWLETDKGNNLMITQVTFLIEYEATIEKPNDISVRAYSKIDNSRDADLVTAQFIEDNSTLNIVKKTAADDIVAYSIDANGNVEKLKEMLN